MKVHLDYELRSRCGLTTRGSWNYSMDPSTEILCLAYAFDEAKPILAVPPLKETRAVNWPPKDLLTALSYKSNTVHAHNATFERFISRNISTPRFQWPEIDPMQWRCSMSVAAYHALPRSLDGAGEALGLRVKKDMEGAKILKKFMQPMKNGEWYWNADEFKKLCAYCGTDVEVEREIENYLGELPDYELQIWLLDQIVNERGILFDRKMAEAAIEIAADQKARANIDLFEMTGGVIKKATERNSLIDWAKTQGYDLTGKKITKDTVPDMLEDPKVPAQLKRVLRKRFSVSASSVSKYKAMLNLMDTHGVVRDTLRYFGAGTGRWAGKGVQIQNFPKGYTAPSKKDLSLGMDEICQALVKKDLSWIELFDGDDPMDALKKATRGAIKARPGKEMIVADYAGIEARCLMWVVGDTEAVASLKTGDIYCDMASAIYARHITKADKDARQLGKQAILGCGYGMGYPKFLLTLQGYRIKLGETLVRQLVGDEFEALEKFVRSEGPRITAMGINLQENLIELIGCKFIVDKYRAKYPKIKAFWKNIEDAARDAIKSPGVRVPCEKVSFMYDPIRDMLFCRLPSGRNITYPFPELKMSYAITFYGENKKGRKVKVTSQVDEIKGNERDAARKILESKGYKLLPGDPDIWTSEKITYMKSKKEGFRRISTYGGSLTENCWAAGTKILTDSGWKAIETISKSDLIWDGIEFVSSLGPKSFGIKETIQWLDLLVTPDHKILAGKHWKRIADLDTKSKYDALKLGQDSVLSQFWKPDVVSRSHQSYGVIAELFARYSIANFGENGPQNVKNAVLNRAGKLVPDIRSFLSERLVACGLIGTLGLSADAITRSVQRTKITAPEGLVYSPRGKKTGLSSLSTWSLLRTGTKKALTSIGSTMTEGMSLGIYGSQVDPKTHVTDEPISLSSIKANNIQNQNSAKSFAGGIRAIIQSSLGSIAARLSSRLSKPMTKNTEVFDLINCGPRHRYMVLTEAGPVIAHNCMQGISRDLIAEAMLRAEAAGFNPIMTVHDELVGETEIGKVTVHEFEQLICELPVWAEGFPIAAEGFSCRRYRK